MANKFKPGDRVRNLHDNGIVKKGATGTVDEDSHNPNVIWDSIDMIQEPKRNTFMPLRWAQAEEHLELIQSDTEVKDIKWDGVSIQNMMLSDESVPGVEWNPPKSPVDLCARLKDVLTKGEYMMTHDSVRVNDHLSIIRVQGGLIYAFTLGSSISTTFMPDK